MPQPSPLLGREVELERLEAVLDAAPQRGCAVMLVGEPGIGKSALQAALVDSARARGYGVLLARGSPGERHLAFAGLHQLLAPVLSRADDLPVRQRDALLSAFGMAGTESPDPFLIALAALGLVTAVADAPLLLSLDDMHWLDQPTKEVVEFLARRISHDPVVLVVSVRPETTWTDDAASMDRLDVGGLPDEVSAALVDRAAPALSQLLRQRVLSTARGNPLALLELPVAAAESAQDLATGTRDLPLTARLERAFSDRARDLPAAARTALTVAAVDDGRDVAEIIAATGVLLGRTDMTVDALQPALDDRLVTTDGVILEFRHPLVRSAIHRVAGAGHRKAAHAALAQVLADQPDRAAWHTASSISSPHEDVAARLEQAADRARRRGAVTTAVAWLERAAELSPDPASRNGRLLSAAEVAFELGRFALVEQLRSRIDVETLRPRDRSRLIWLDGVFYDGRPVAPSVIENMVDLARTATSGGDDNLALDLLVGAARRTWWADPGAALRTAVVSSAEQLHRPTDDPKLLITCAIALPVDRGAFVIDQLSRWQPDPGTPAEIMEQLGTVAFCVGDFPRAIDLLTAPMDTLRAQGRLSLLAQALSLRAWAALFVGAFELARSGDEAARLSEVTGQPRWAAITAAALAMLGGLRHGRPAAEAALGNAEEVAMEGPLPMRSLLSGIQLARGTSHLSAGQYDAAFSNLHRMYQPQHAAFHHMLRVWAVGYLAEAAAHSGNRDEGRRILSELEPLAAASPSVGIHLAMDYARAVLADRSDAEALFLSGLSGPAAMFPWHRGRLELSYGAWLRRSRRVPEARARLLAARDSLDGMGLATWADQADQELRASGDRGRQRGRGSWDLLTPQEAQIAELAAQGLSNRDIGQRLYMSPRTVGSHLYHAFPKLGVASRAQLGRALAPRSLPPT